MTYKEIKELQLDEVLIQMKDAELLEEVKQHLNITWDDEDGNILRLIIEGKQYLFKKVGTAINFSKDFMARGLLKDYCRYVRNYSKEYFEQNFIDDILFLQLEYAGKAQKNE